MKKDFEESLAIYRDLAEKTPELYLEKVADALVELASLPHRLGRDKEAEKEEAEVEAIRRKLAEMDPEEE